MAIIAGTPSNDSLSGSSEADVIDALAGDDTIVPIGNDDTVDGGAGNDSIDGGDGNDLLNGGTGRDLLYGNIGDDTLNDSGYDTLLGGAGNDRLNLYGSAQPGSTGGALLDGGSDNDQLWLNFAGRASLLGGSGDDLLESRSWTAARQWLHGGEGDDTINATQQRASTILGGEGQDLIRCAGTDLQVNGGGGNDTLRVSGDNNSIYGGAGDDWIDLSRVSFGSRALPGFAVVGGGAGRDTITLSPQQALLRRGPVHVSDFATGPDGDRLDLRPVISHLQQNGMSSTAAPFAEGWLRLTPSASGLMLEMAASGSGSERSYVALLHFASISNVASFTPDNFLPPLQAAGSSNAAVPELDDLRQVEILEDGSASLGLAAPFDPDGGEVSIRITDLPSARFGQIVLADGSRVASGQVLTAEQLSGLQVQMASDYDGSDARFHYAVSDDEGSTRHGQVLLHVLPQNDAPIILPWQNMHYVDGHTLDIALFDLVNDPDRNHSELALQYSISMADGSALPEWIDVSNPLRLRGQVPAGFTDTLQLRLTVSDGIAPPVSRDFPLSLGGLFDRAYALKPDLVGGSGNDRLFGGSINNHFQGLGGQDVLSGGPGMDTLDGGSEADRMHGGLGDDLFYVDHRDDQVRELRDGGQDSVIASSDWTLMPYTEDLTLAGATARVGIGNSRDNRLHGNALGNRLHGGSGHDTLTGHGGNDSLYGSSGNDVYHFGRGDGQDRIRDLDATAGNHDVLLLAEGIGQEDLLWSRKGADLQLQLAGSSDQIVFVDWFSPVSAQVEELRLADGTVLTAADMQAMVDGLVQASAAVPGAAEAGFSPAHAPQPDMLIFSSAC